MNLIPLKYLGIEDVNEEPALWIELVSKRSKLSVFWFILLWFFLYFFLVDVLLRFFIIFPQENFVDLIKKYIFFILSWNFLWIYSIWLIYYFRNLYIKTINNLYEKKILIRDQHGSLREQFLDSRYRYIFWIISILFILAHIGLSLNNHIPTIIFGIHESPKDPSSLLF